MTSGREMRFIDYSCQPNTDMGVMSLSMYTFQSTPGTHQLRWSDGVTCHVNDKRYHVDKILSHEIDFVIDFVI